MISQCVGDATTGQRIRLIELTFHLYSDVPFALGEAVELQDRVVDPQSRWADVDGFVRLHIDPIVALFKTTNGSDRADDQRDDDSSNEPGQQSSRALHGSIVWRALRLTRADREPWASPANLGGIEGLLEPLAAADAIGVLIPGAARAVMRLVVALNSVFRPACPYFGAEVAGFS